MLSRLHLKSDALLHPVFVLQHPGSQERPTRSINKQEGPTAKCSSSVSQPLESVASIASFWLKAKERFGLPSIKSYLQLHRSAAGSCLSSRPLSVSYVRCCLSPAAACINDSTPHGPEVPIILTQPAPTRRITTPPEMPVEGILPASHPTTDSIVARSCARAQRTCPESTPA